MSPKARLPRITRRKTRKEQTVKTETNDQIAKSPPAPIRIVLKTKRPRHEPRAVLDYRKGYLCVMREYDLNSMFGEGPIDLTRNWYEIRPAEEAEVRALVGLPLRVLSDARGIFADEEGRSYRLARPKEVTPFDQERVMISCEGVDMDPDLDPEKSGNSIRRGEAS